MSVDRISEIIKESNPEDVQKLLEMIMYEDEQNCKIPDQELMDKNIALQRQVYEAMCLSMPRKEALRLLDKYEESNCEIQEVENQHWFKAGIRTGIALSKILYEE